ncbi:hypothetical protein ZWY2020_003169 [Hordeum vulgare]|nr:hypothetical protein ZWY2020_003169 [Hordeum vulgare]
MDGGGGSTGPRRRRGRRRHKTTVLYPLDTCKIKFEADIQTDQGAHKYRSPLAVDSFLPPSLPLRPFACVPGLILSRIAGDRRLEDWNLGPPLSRSSDLGMGE